MGVVMYSHPMDHVILVDANAYSLVPPWYLVVFNETLYGCGFSLLLTLKWVSAKHWVLVAACLIANYSCPWITNTHVSKIVAHV